MASEVKIKVTVDDDSKAGIASVKSGMHDVETASDKAGNALTAVKNRGNELRADLVKLDDGLKKNKQALSMLTSALANTDDAMQRLDISKAISKIESDMAAATKAKKFKLSELMDLEPDRESATSFMSKFGGLLSTAGNGAASLAGNHVGMTIGAAAGAAAAPILISVIGTALSAQAGASGIGAGIALAVKNDKGIQEAGKLMGQTFMDKMGESAKVYNKPILQSIGILEDAGDRVAARWSRVFAATSDDVVPLVRNLVQAGETISNALAGAAENSGEALDGLGDSVRLIASGVGDFITVVSDGGPEAANNLRMIAGAIGDVLRQSGLFLDTVNKLGNNEWLTGPLLPLLRKHYKDTADASDTLGDSTAALAKDSAAAARAAQGQAEAFDDLNKELKAQADPVFGIIKAQEDLKKAQDDTAEAVKKHGKNSSEARDAFQKQALAALELEGNVGKLGDTFNGKLTPSMRATLRAAGLTEDAIDAVERQFKEAKRAGDRFEGNYKANLSLDGYRNAKGQLSGLLRDLQNFDGKWTATMITNYVRHGKPGTGGGLAHGGIKGAADGGLRSDLTWVGENGPELLRLPPSAQVHSNADSQRMVATGEAMGGAGGSSMLVAEWVSSGDEILDALAKGLRVYVKNHGNGNVQATFGQER